MTAFEPKTMETAAEATETETGALLAHLWPQVREAHAAVADARRTGDEHLPERLIRFRTLALLMAAEPARSWNDVLPKILLQALLHHEQSTVALSADPHLVDMLEAAIMADHAALNGDDRPDIAAH